MHRFTVYHESKHLFSHPDMERANALRTVENHANGALGVWVSVLSQAPRGAGLYGEHLYKVTVECETDELKVMHLNELAQFAHEHRDGDLHDAHTVWREQLLESGIKLIVLAEADMSTKQAIVLDVSTIKNFQLLERQL